MKILPELETYRDRLMDKAATWAETPAAALQRELDQCQAQIELLETSSGRMRQRLQEVHGEEADALSRRLSVQEQLRELTAAYATVLRRHLEGRVS